MWQAGWASCFRCSGPVTRRCRNATDSRSEGTGWPNHLERHHNHQSRLEMSLSRPLVDLGLPVVAGRNSGCSNCREAYFVDRKCSTKSIVQQPSCNLSRVVGSVVVAAIVAGQGSLRIGRESTTDCYPGCTTRKPLVRKMIALGQNSVRIDQTAERQVVSGDGLPGLE